MKSYEQVTKTAFPDQDAEPGKLCLLPASSQPDSTGLDIQTQCTLRKLLDIVTNCKKSVISIDSCGGISNAFLIPNDKKPEKTL